MITHTMGRRVRSTALGYGAAMLWACAAAAQPVHGASHRFDIPAENTALALNAFARQSGLAIVFPYQQASATSSPGVHGIMTDEVALLRILQGADLELAAEDAHSVSLRARPLSAGRLNTNVEQAAAPDAATASASEGSRSPSSVAEVVVTASKRAQNVEHVPFTVTALSQRDLSARGAQTVEQAISYVPGVNFTSNGANTGAYTIRGVNTASVVTNTQSPVALYIDDINILDPVFPRVTTNLRTFDVNRVEVLEGPQGTLFGSGSLGGAIRAITNKPDPRRYAAETEDTVSGTDGGGLNYDLNAMVNVPIVADTLALRVVGYYQKDAGYVDNTARAQTDVNHAISQGARIELGWTPTPDLKLLGSVLFQNDRPHDSAYSYYDSRSYTWNGLVATPAYNNTRIYSLTGTYDLRWASLTSITTYADRYENIQSDFSADAQKFFGITAPSPVNDEGPSRTFSQEVRLASPDSGRFRWLIGGIYLNNRREDREPAIVPGSGALFGVDSDVISLSDEFERIREGAVFGEASYDLLPRLTATVGLRVFNDHLATTDHVSGTIQTVGTTVTDVSETAATPKFNLSYRLTPFSMVYFQASEGYRIGQANSVVTDPVSHEVIPPSSSPDKLWNYEIGQKGTFFDGRLVVNASLYYIDWSNIQLDERTVPTGLLFIANAGDAHIKGAELEVRARPTRDWDIGGSLSLDDSRLESVNPTVAATKGDRLPGSAPQNVVLYTGYTYQLGDNASLFGRIDAKYVGKEYADLINSTSLTYGRYTTLNLRAGMNWSRYTVTAFVDNAADASGRVSAFPNLGQSVAIRQRPMTAGLTVDARF